MHIDRHSYNPSNDGRYVGGNDGRYVHVAGKDGPGAAAYVGGQVGGGKYTGSGGGGGGSGGGGAQIANRFGAGSGSAGAGRTPTSGSANRGQSINPRPTAAAGPQGGWRTIRDEKTETVDGYHYL